jgi:hypothetical protein
MWIILLAVAIAVPASIGVIGFLPNWLPAQADEDRPPYMGM